MYWQQASSLPSDLEALKEKDKNLANELGRPEIFPIQILLVSKRTLEEKAAVWLASGKD